MAIVRDAQPSDFSKIKEIRWAAYQEHERKLTAQHWDGLSSSFNKTYEEIESVQSIVVEIDQEIVGTVVLFPAEVVAYTGTIVSDKLQYPELRLIAVSPQYRGRGIGKILVEECIKRVKEAGYPAMGLHTADFMGTAVKMYEEFGFQRVPEDDFTPLDDGIVVKAFRIYV